jgi:hypothetical protein
VRRPEVEVRARRDVVGPADGDRGAEGRSETRRVRAGLRGERTGEGEREAEAGDDLHGAGEMHAARG